MAVTGVVEGNVVRLYDADAIPDGTLVRIVPEDIGANEIDGRLTLGEWLQRARKTRAQMPITSDSAEILRELREERANR